MDSKTVHANRQELQILDVREDAEWAAGRIDGAVHIPLGELDRRMGEPDRDRSVVTVCRGGGRAREAAELLSSAGVSAEVMDGGMTQWAENGLPFTTPEGRPGQLA
jgi:rhodanese-related sulfurtransferase